MLLSSFNRRGNRVLLEQCSQQNVKLGLKPRKAWPPSLCPKQYLVELLSAEASRPVIFDGRIDSRHHTDLAKVYFSPMFAAITGVYVCDQMNHYVLPEDISDRSLPSHPTYLIVITLYWTVE